MTSWSRQPKAVPIGIPTPGQDGKLWSPDELPSDGAARARNGAAGNAPLTDTARESRIADEARARGHDEGFRAGQAAEAARLQSAAAALEGALHDAREGEERWVANAEENICALAIAVARHVIAREVSVDPAIVTNLVREAVAEFPVTQPVVIRVNPADLQAVHEALGAGGARDELRWVADPRIVPGGCLVAGRERIVDGRVDVGLERIYNRLVHGGH